MAEEGQHFIFQGFGPLPVPEPTHMGGVGSGASFAPMVDSAPKSRIPRKALLPTGGAATVEPNPFGIMTQTTLVGGTPTVQFGVYATSDLLGIFCDSTSGIAITGLLSSYPPSPTDSGWVNSTESALSVYLELAIASYAITTATIKFDSSYVGGNWVTGGDTTGSGTPVVQTFARKLIGEIGEGNEITQKVFTNLGMYSLCINGKAAIYPIAI
jgi:hypothetical protein